MAFIPAIFFNFEVLGKLKKKLKKMKIPTVKDFCGIDLRTAGLILGYVHIAELMMSYYLGLLVVGTCKYVWICEQDKAPICRAHESNKGFRG